MSAAEPETPSDPTGRFEYFMLRIFRAEESPQSVAGQVERLGTGEKRQFETAEELVTLLDQWPAAHPDGEITAMRNILRTTTLIGTLVVGSLSGATAQSDAVAPDTLAGASDTTAPKKGGGLFGKVKGVAKNKVVQQVAKTAACTMLPGGQVVASAIDAAADKDAVGAAAGAATGTSCMPGIGGAGAVTGGAMAAGGMPGGVGMPSVAASGAMDAAMMATYSVQMAAVMPPGMPSMGGGEAEGRTLEIPADLAGDLRKGKTVIRNIDWLPGAATVSPGAARVTAQAMRDVAAGMTEAGASYRVDLYLDKRYADLGGPSIGQQRVATVQAWLLEGGAPAPAAGKLKKDKNPRLEVVRVE